ncbi:MAG: aminotransferase class IV family protein [Tabrizicola sp.]|uniref:aminotransferase class IV family protein n=1 Tax=Tabrizicola sp. TaxID=2005166 RepID=UPI00273486DB|nr:aminotransferase class IV family protein [Tabrizicola sp.]MDP3264318.1 aminotransferase class IV family protein [Tabrizicola sp.]MDP3648637.1 aminotransferase class IV family protein [Paracoccaceae bacterium]
MLWDGTRFPRLALHMARLARGAEALGWDAPHVDLAATRPDDPARVRLTLGAAGDMTVEVAALPPPKPLWRVGLAETRLSSTDPWLTVKSTRREVYDLARATLPVAFDEMIFLNEHGEVCDGTITTVFFDRGQGMRTPPLASGLLPGVLRAELACPEERLLAADLPQVKLWVGNALRGIAPAQFFCSQISPPEAPTPGS